MAIVFASDVLSSTINFYIIVTVNPMAPTIPSDTPLGTVVASISVTTSDRSPFTGTLVFGPPNFDDGSIYSLTGSGASWSLLVNPSGPGVGSEGGNVDHVTVVAVE